METIGDRLKYYRQKKGMTQEEVAEKLGIQKSNYQKYESGQRNPKDERITELAKILDCGFLPIKYGEKDLFIASANDYIRKAIMGEELVYTSFAEDWEYGDLTTEITEFFCSYADELEEVNPDFYDQYVIDPSPQNIFVLADKFYYAYRNRIVNPDNYQNDFDEIEDIEDDAINPTQWYGIAFSNLVIQYLSTIESDQQVLEDTKEVLDEENASDEQARLQFAAKVFALFLHFIIETVSAMFEEGGTFEEHYLKITE